MVKPFLAEDGTPTVMLAFKAPEELSEFLDGVAAIMEQDGYRVSKSSIIRTILNYRRDNIVNILRALRNDTRTVAQRSPRRRDAQREARKKNAGT